MNKINYTILVVFFNVLVQFFALMSYAQNNEKYEFIGTIKLSTNQLFTYRLNFDISQDGKIQGETHTDFLGKNSTKSKIAGTYNSKENSISFRETGNITTKSSAEAQDFCYVNAQNLKITNNKGQQYIKGKFDGYFENGTKCISGNLYLVSTDVFEQFGVSKNQIDSIVNLDSLNTDKMMETVPLKNKETKEIQWKSNKVTLYVWDSKKEDKDKIDIYFNGKLLYPKLEITNNKQRIEIPFNKNSKNGEIKIVAVDEGIMPSNTVNAVLIDEDNLTPFSTKLKKGEFVLINLHK